MYFLFGILVLISFVFVILFSRRKKKKNSLPACVHESM